VQGNALIAACTLAAAAWLALTIPVLVAGFIQLRGWRPNQDAPGSRSPGWLARTVVDTGTDACFGLSCLPILIVCWSCGRIANAAAGTSTRHLRMCLSALTSAPGAATARRTSWMASVRTAAASSSVVPSARSTCSQSTRHRPSGLSGQDALRHPPADPPIGQQELTAPTSQAMAHACGPSHRRAPRESTPAHLWSALRATAPGQRAFRATGCDGG
jgi:hypothetical protein